MPTRGINFETLSLLDALDLAILMEEEAEERYLELAAQMQTHRSPDAAHFFYNMARNEAKHAAELRVRRRILFANEPRRLDRNALFDVEAPDYDEARAFMTARTALHVALRSELKARAFFELALPVIRDPAVAALFATLRDEEIEHVHSVRAALLVAPAEDGVEPDAFADDPVGL